MDHEKLLNEIREALMSLPGINLPSIVQIGEVDEVDSNSASLTLELRDGTIIQLQTYEG
jgi:hypothetical protein